MTKLDDPSAEERTRVVPVPSSPLAGTEPSSASSNLSVSKGGSELSVQPADSETSVEGSVAGGLVEDTPRKASQLKDISQTVHVPTRRESSPGYLAVPETTFSRQARQHQSPPNRKEAQHHEEESDAPEDPPPPEDELRVEDSPYSWVVACGAAIHFIIVGGIHKSFGLVLAALVQEHGFTAAQVAIIPAFYFAVSFIISPLTGALCRRFSERQVAAGGSVFSMLGLALSSLTTDLHVLFVTNGLMFGLGQGFSNVPCTLMVTKYFEKRRGLANAITAASAAIGGTFFPVMVQAMLEEFGIPGTYLVIGGLHLHTLISAMLFRPLELQRRIMLQERRRRLRKEAWRRGESVTQGKTGGDIPVLAVNGDKAEVTSLLGGAEPPRSERLNMSHGMLNSVPPRVAELRGAHLSASTPDVDRAGSAPRRRWSTAGSGAAERDAHSSALLHAPLRHRRGSEAIASSTAMLSQISLVAAPVEEREEPARPAGWWAQVLRSLDLRLLADPLYVACVSSVFLFACGLPHVCILVPRFAVEELGVSRADVARMISLIAPIDITSRLSLGFILDRNLFHKRYGVLITCAVGAVGILTLSLVRSYAGLFVAGVFVYAAIGFYFVVVPVMYAEYYGVARLSSTLTMSNMFSGLANMVAQPLCGLLRDAVGSFRPVFGLLASLMTVGGGLVLLHPCIVRAVERRRQLTDKEREARKA